MNRVRLMSLVVLLVLPLLSCQPGNGVSRTVVAWDCHAEKNVMAIEVEQESSGVQLISFDGGGMAVHLEGLRPFAPDYDQVRLVPFGESGLNIHFIASGDEIRIQSVGERCFQWLRRNDLIEPGQVRQRRSRTGAAQRVDSVSDLVGDAQRMDGKLVAVQACLNVSPHGMTLGDCGRTGSPQLNFGPGTDREPYDALVQAGFDSMLAPRTSLTVSVTGTFQKSSDNRFDLLIVDEVEITQTSGP